jgi:hypothetical protein
VAGAKGLTRDVRGKGDKKGAAGVKAVKRGLRGKGSWEKGRRKI